MFKKKRKRKKGGGSNIGSCPHVPVVFNDTNFDGDTDAMVSETQKGKKGGGGQHRVLSTRTSVNNLLILS
jgi:hypothetical protein